MDIEVRKQVAENYLEICRSSYGLPLFNLMNFAPSMIEEGQSILKSLVSAQRFLKADYGKKPTNEKKWDLGVVGGLIDGVRYTASVFRSMCEEVRKHQYGARSLLQLPNGKSLTELLADAAIGSDVIFVKKEKTQPSTVPRILRSVEELRSFGKTQLLPRDYELFSIICNTYQEVSTCVHDIDARAKDVSSSQDYRVRAFGTLDKMTTLCALAHDGVLFAAQNASREQKLSARRLENYACRLNDIAWDQLAHRLA